MLEIELLPNQFKLGNGKFDKENAKIFCGKIAGVCYDEEGFSHINLEDKTKTEKRIKRTLDSGHHSVYDHVTINLNLKNIPKILAMVLNNEKQYTTSEKSARYTKINNENEMITENEINLYNKWFNIFQEVITKKYSNCLSDIKIRKLSQENARYFVSTFIPTQMVYSTTFRQINYIAKWMIDFIDNKDNHEQNEFNKKLEEEMVNFVNELDRLNILENGLMKNEKQRQLSLFTSNLSLKEDYFNYVYDTTYKGSFASLAQAQRHRTLGYQIELLKEKEYFVPPILNDYLRSLYLEDIKSVASPQGEIVLINEIGNYDDFILKCKERLCTEAQLEIMLQTKETLKKYQDNLNKTNSPLKEDIKNYCNGARCTFNTYTCLNDCKFKEGKMLTRKI